jgi:hypothetical protein
MPASRPPLDLSAALREMVECVVEERLPEIVEKVVERALLERGTAVPELLTTKQAAQAYPFAEDTLNQWRSQGIGQRS